MVGGDFIAGPSHELPTGGAGKSFPGLTVDQFQRRTSNVRFDKKSLKKSLSFIRTFQRDRRGWMPTAIPRRSASQNDARKRLRTRYIQLVTGVFRRYY